MNSIFHTVRPGFGIVTLIEVHLWVLSDECELVSVWHECGDIMQHKVDATRREQRCVEV